MNPYFLMAILYLSLAVLAAADSSLTSLNVLPWYNGLRWLRIHLITLGTVTEVAFGLLPLLVARRAGQPRPKMRWDIWLSLNAGLLTLLIGIPLINGALILAGGTLVFIATTLLLMQLKDLAPTRAAVGSPLSRRYYISALSYLLLGIFLGTGLWLGWSEVLQIAVPLEVHIHANNWGFMSLLFAGLLIDLYPRFAGRSLAWPRSLDAIFWMMTVGALGLVLGPWFDSLYFAVPGLVLHLTGTIWLVLNVVKPLLGDRTAWTPGMWHIVTSYAWIIAPVLVAPLIILGVPGFPGAGIERNAPQALIYGWVLQFGYALIPYLFARLFLPEKPAKLGGNWFSLITVHIGGIFLWVSIFNQPLHGPLHATAYIFWVLSAVPILVDLWRIFRTGLAKIEDEGSLRAGNEIIAAD